MVNQLNLFLSEKSSDWGLPAAGAWNFWVYNNSQPHCTNIDIMWFHNDDEFPRVVTKLDRKSGALSREFENLTRVYSCAPAYVPRPLKFGRMQDFWVLWMEGLPGLPFHPDYFSQSLRTIVEMLLSIHSALRDQHRRTDSERYRRMVAAPLDSAAQFGDSAAVRAGCARLSRSIDEEWLRSLPAIPQHGDFYPGNVTLFRGRPRILDWETFGTIDLPFFDLLTFLVALLLPEGAVPPEFETNLAQHVAPAVALYAKTIGLAVPDLELLLPLSLINWFHSMKLDGRERFATRMHRWIEHYFEHPEIWRRTFLPA